MKPKDLKFPEKRTEGQVVLHQGVLFIPGYAALYESFSFPGWKALFGNENPVRVEYCSGNGQWIADKAEADPSINWVAIERQFDRVQKIWSKRENRSLRNLFIVCGEALAATNRYFPAGSIDAAYMNFPDPWPKKRHAKNRLVQPLFADEIHRVLLPGREMTLVTDDPDYSQIMIEVFNGDKRFESCYPPPYFSTEETRYGGSYFLSLWKSKGRTIRYHQFRRV